MKPSWIFETDVSDEGVRRTAGEVIRQGMEVRWADQLGRFDKTYVDLFPAHACVVFYGTLGFAFQVRRETTWIPGVYHTPSEYLCSNYYPVLGEHLLAQNYAMLPFGELLRKRDFLFENWGLEDTLFVRPNSGSKPFTGQLVGRGTFERDLKTLGSCPVPPGEIVVVSEPRNVVSEWRLVVVDGKVVAGTSYRLGGESCREPIRPGHRKEISQLADRVLDTGFSPDRAWTLDLCETTSGSLYVLEVNAFSTSGLYACEAEPVVREVSRVALEDWEDVNG